MQVAVRTPKKDGTWSYAVLVSTDINATLEELLDMTNAVVPRRTLSHRIIKHSLYENTETGFIAQQVLLLLAEAHNLMIWMKTWFIE